MPTASTSPRKQPRQARAKATRDAIVTAAAQLFASAGVARASTNAIAERAGVSIGSLYEYFPNKDAIVAALIEELLDQQFVTFSAALTRVADAPFEELAREAITVLIATKRIRPKLFHALATGAPPAIRLAFLRRWNQRARDAVLAVLSARPDSACEDRDLELMVYVMVNGVYGVIDAVLTERSQLIEDDRLVDELVLLVARYAAPNPPPA